MSEPRLIDREEAAAYLGVRPDDLLQLPLTPIRLGARTIRYDKRALDQYRLDAANSPVCVYFIRGRSTGLIKIGSSKDVVFRYCALQTGSPDVLEIVGTIKGGLLTESALHLRFAHLRQHGEWFAPGDDLLVFIAEHAKEEP